MFEAGLGHNCSFLSLVAWLPSPTYSLRGSRRKGAHPFFTSESGELNLPRYVGPSLPYPHRQSWGEMVGWAAKIEALPGNHGHPASAELSSREDSRSPSVTGDG